MGMGLWFEEDSRWDCGIRARTHIRETIFVFARKKNICPENENTTRKPLK